MNDKVVGREIRVRGHVQGVGFRPTVWHLAHRSGLTGEVMNDGQGVLIRVWGNEGGINAFLAKLRNDIPPLARIDTLDCRDCRHPAPADFVISKSVPGPVRPSVAPDAATCPDCLSELRDPNNRRYRYPFTNCTHCGPRLSILRAFPYDRANTSMATFKMCAACQSEYDNPADRRFHAQPNACPECGPRLWLCDADGRRLGHKDPIEQAAELLRQGYILAIKGVGGFHLACDATNAGAVERLRARKSRYGKPLALMACSVAVIETFAHVTEDETRALQAAAAPIVLLRKRDRGHALAPALAPGHAHIGVMLPYTPLHHLLLAAVGFPLVMTSANRSHEPQVIENDQALERLTGIADYWVMHDRAIVNRLDDSVMQIVSQRPMQLRRGRGHAPDPVILPDGFARAPNILAMGADLKATFCLVKDGQAMLSQHIGDLSNASAHADYRKTLDLFEKLYDFTPNHIVTDLHPNYQSTQWGDRLAASTGVAVTRVQHHHAHIAACLAEHRVPLDAAPVIGIAFDGVGFGGDSGYWGGEFLIADYLNYERAAWFDPVALPGGDAAARTPWRNTYAHLQAALGWPRVQAEFGGLGLVRFLERQPLCLIDQMIASRLNTPITSSVGRIFDAVAGALNICSEKIDFEGQAAMELTAMAEEQPNELGGYPFELSPYVSLRPMWYDLLSDLAANTAPQVIAKRFHNTIVAATSDMALKTVQRSGTTTAVLTGGVFQNHLLRAGVAERLSNAGLTVLTPSKIPAHDGGVALGQAVIAAARLQEADAGTDSQARQIAFADGIQT